MKMNLMKKKKRKGFTLIELIVVIAILGILAALAVPRLAGFTDKAKIASDKETASIVDHSIKTMVAAGDIKITSTGTPTYTVTIINDATSGILAYTFGTAFTGTGITTAEMEKLVGKHKLGYYTTSIVLTVDVNGETVSTVGTKDTVATTF